MKIFVVALVVSLMAQVQGNHRHKRPASISPKLERRYLGFPVVGFDAEKETEFHLHTRSNPNESVKLDMFGGEIASQFDRKKPTKLVIHGFWNSRESPVAKRITAAYLKNFDVNVIVVNWGNGANPLLISYDQAAARTREVGKIGAQFLMWLLKDDPKMWDNLTVVGHSLGAHTAGFIGKNLSNGKKIGRIVGLDPAGPEFSGSDKQDRLDESDARYVEAIHTNCGGLGITERVATADFYPNKGFFQPSCCLTADEMVAQVLTGIVSNSLQRFLANFNQNSHSRAIDLFVESLSNNQFQAVRCDDKIDFKVVDERKRAELCPMRGATAYFGGEPGNGGDPDVHGVYYFNTNGVPPYGQGTYWKSAQKKAIADSLENGKAPKIGT